MRKSMVTRTIKTTVVTLMCLDIMSGDPKNETITLPATFKDNKSLLKKAQSALETDTFKVVHVVDKKEVETLYGMDEQFFIENAKVLDPESRKEIEQ